MILLPIFSVFAIGYLVGKMNKLDIRTLSFVAIHVFCSFLAFHTFYTNELTSDHLYIFATLVLLVFIILAIILLISKVFHINKTRKHAMLLASLFMNGGNLGVPVVMFTIGDEGFVYALMIMVAMDFLMNSLGIYIAASGGEVIITKRQALLRTLKMPIVSASLLGILFQATNVVLPEQVENTVALLADAAIPLVMIVLGIQLSTIRLNTIEYKPVSFIVLLRLVISPLLTLGIVTLLGIGDTVLATVLVIIAAMPSAANATIFSVQFNVDPDFVSATTFIGTIASLVSLPIWLAVL